MQIVHKKKQKEGKKGDKERLGSQLKSNSSFSYFHVMAV
jgi:hypothetical protein